MMRRPNGGTNAGVIAAVVVFGLAGGCKQPPPDVVAVEGVVRIDDKPLASALVRFIPMTPGLPGTWIAAGVTDSDGKFTLEMPDRSGAPVGTHRVTVEEAPVPDEARQSQGEVAKYLAGLKLRPIPKQYGAVSRTPLTIEVKAGGPPVELTLTR